MTIENHSQQGPATRSAGSISQQRIIRRDGSGAYQDGIMFMSQLVHPGARLFSGNPARISGPRGDLSVKRSRNLQVNERPSGAHEVNVFLVDAFGLSCQKPAADFNAAGAKM